MTDSWTEKLVRDLKPVQVKSPFRMSGIALVMGVFYAIACLLLFFHLRLDAARGQFQASYFFGLAVAILSTVLFAAYAFSSAVPGRRETRALFWISSSTLVSAFLVLGFWPLSNHPVVETGEPGWACTLSVGLLGLGFVGAQLFWLRRLIPVSGTKIGLMSGISSAALGAVALAFVCPNAEPEHLLYWHFTCPLFLYTVLGGVLGRYLLRW